MIGAAQRNVDLSLNTLVVGTLKVGGSSGTDLTKVILDSLISGSADASALHNHNTQYYTKAEVDTQVTTASNAGANKSLSNLTSPTSINQDLILQNKVISGLSGISANSTSTVVNYGFTADSYSVKLFNDPTHPNEVQVVNIGTMLPLNTPVTFSGLDLPAPLVAGTTYYSSGAAGTGLGLNSVRFLASVGGSTINFTTTGSGQVTFHYYEVTAGTIVVSSKINATGHSILATDLQTNGIKQFGSSNFVVDVQNSILKLISGTSVIPLS